MILHTEGMLLPCAIDMFHGTGHVCCPQHKIDAANSEKFDLQNLDEDEVDEIADASQGESTKVDKMAAMEHEEDELDYDYCEGTDDWEEESSEKDFYIKSLANDMEVLSTSQPTDEVGVYFEIPAGENECAHFAKAKQQREVRHSDRLGKQVMAVDPDKAAMMKSQVGDPPPSLLYQVPFVAEEIQDEINELQQEQHFRVNQLASGSESQTAFDSVAPPFVDGKPFRPIQIKIMPAITDVQGSGMIDPEGLVPDQNAIGSDENNVNGNVVIDESFDVK
ncbi:hypothetical protein scyTo_0010554 [Scyliorhinus torazame]|uniref:E1 domain-containing protein n=1 Tax=Scyliorhinus torazame TaxID=75743 RepID=A0A401P8H5_SCYTO|nr:hypothetical protein [Scyliorhinus torazame]